MILQRKSIPLIIVLLVPLALKASYMDRFSAVTNNYARQAAARSSTASFFRPQLERKRLVPADPKSIEQAEKKAEKAYREAQEANGHLLSAEDNWRKANDDFEKGSNICGANCGTAEIKRLANDAVAAKDSAEAWRIEGMKRYEAFVAARRKADTLRGDTSGDYRKGFSIALYGYDQWDENNEREKAAHQNFGTHDFAGPEDAEAVHEQEDKKREELWAAQLPNLRYMEYQAKNEIENARTQEAKGKRVNRARAVELYQAEKEERERVEGNYRRLRAYREHLAAQKASSETSPFLRWWNSRASAKRLEKKPSGSTLQEDKDWRIGWKAKKEFLRSAEDRWNPAGY